jgi:Flp pilus assembly protein TadD
VEAAQRAVEIDPELPQAQLALALIKGAAGAGDLDVASILARHPSPSAAHRDLGYLYERAGRLDRAESEFREATKEDPDDWFNWYTLGVFLFRHRDLDAARSAYDRAIALAPPGVTRPRENLAALEIQASRFDQAIDLLEGLPHGSGDGNTANNLATAYFFSRRPDKWEKAEKHYREAVARDPRRSGFRGNLADLYAATGRSAEALAEYRAAMSLAQDEARTRSGDAGARLLVALYGAKAQECPSALELAGEVEKEVASSSQLLHQLALVYSLCRERERTLETLRAAIALGFAPAFAAQEEEFRWLAGDPEFASLTAQRR